MRLGQREFPIMDQNSLAEQHKRIMEQEKIRKVNKQKGLNRLKKEIAAMLPIVEKIEAKRKEKEEADKLDMEIQARVRAYKKEYYEKL